MVDEKKWYQKREWIYMLVLLFWPVGLYLLWTNKEIERQSKLIVTGIFLILLVIGLLMNEEDMFYDIRRIFRKLF